MNCDNPLEFDKLPQAEQDYLLVWISDNLIKQANISSSVSVGMLRDLVTDKSGNKIYVSNGAMQGALLKLGFKLSQVGSKCPRTNISIKSLPIQKKFRA